MNRGILFIILLFIFLPLSLPFAETTDTNRVSGINGKHVRILIGPPGAIEAQGHFRYLECFVSTSLIVPFIAHCMLISTGVGPSFPLGKTNRWKWDPYISTTNGTFWGLGCGFHYQKENKFALSIRLPVFGSSLPKDYMLYDGFAIPIYYGFSLLTTPVISFGFGF